MEVYRYVVISFLALSVVVLRGGHAQTPSSTTAITPTTPVSGATLTTTTNGTTSPTPTSGSSTTAQSITSSGATTATTPPPPAAGTFVGRCPVIPAATNATVQMMVGQWYVMRYQPANPGPIRDQCDRLTVTISGQIGQMQLSLTPASQSPGVTSGYQSETATIQMGATPGTFQYTIPSYGNPLTGYATIVAMSPGVGFIYDVCWLTDPTLQNLVLFATSGTNDAAFNQLQTQASYWEPAWFLQHVNHDGCLQ